MSLQRRLLSQNAHQQLQCEARKTGSALTPIQNWLPCCLIRHLHSQSGQVSSPGLEIFRLYGIKAQIARHHAYARTLFLMPMAEGRPPTSPHLTSPDRTTPISRLSNEAACLTFVRCHRFSRRWQVMIGQSSLFESRRLSQWHKNVSG